MDLKRIIHSIDHTALDPLTTEQEILTFAEKAQGTGVATLCVAPCYVETLVKHFPGGVPICTVVGFPHGNEPANVKAYAVDTAFSLGAREVDVVVHLGNIKAGEWGALYQEIGMCLHRRPKEGVLKVILETGALEDAEIVGAVQILNQLPIEFYKTSTGFGYPGASEHACRLIMAHKRADIQLKASGGIRTLDDAERYLALGATRLGASRLLAACLEAQQ